LVPLPVITGAIGAVAGGLGYAIGTLATGGCFKGGDFSAAVGVGALQGALSPFVGAGGLGGVMNVLQGTITSGPKTGGDLAKEFGIGVVSGLIGGAWKQTPTYSNPKASTEFVDSVNRNRDLSENPPVGIFTRNAIGSTVSTAGGATGGGGSKCK
jgi:hypothetical protein